LADSVSGDRAWVKVSSQVVFHRPFLGKTELGSIQAVHLQRTSRGWLIAEFEELEGAAAKVAFRALAPAATGLAGGGASTAPGRNSSGLAVEPPSPGLLPVSPTAPARGGEADWMRYRVRLRNGAALAERCLLDANQRLDSAVSASEWILENRRAVLPRSGGGKAALPDSMGPYLASNAYLDLRDSLLRAAAPRAAGSVSAAASEPPMAMKRFDPARAARETAAIRAWVTDGFRFELGAVLFGSSREVLRDMTGDCSEAAILTAALLRARRIPSRVALGFASAGQGVFVGHAWTEAWLGPETGWVGVDAALGQFPAGVERLKLAQLDGRGDMRIAATNVMLTALSNLDIEILESRRAGATLPLVVHPGAAGEGGRFFTDILEGFGREAR
jgi:transglutaminase-like putative cysteine protease